MKLQLHIRELVSMLGIFGLYSVPFIPLYYFYPEFWEYYLGASIGIIILNFFHTLVIIKFRSSKKEKLSDEFIQGYVEDHISEIAEEMGVSEPSVSVTPNRLLNASASGVLQYTGHITVTSETVSQLNKSQLRTVLAHEISHIKSRDMFVMYILQSPYILSRKVSLFCQKVSADGTTNLVIKLPLLIVIMLVEIFSRILLLLIRNVSRKREYLADYDAAQVTNPQTVISTLKRIDEYNSQFTQEDAETNLLDDFSSSLFSTHPSMDDRISAIQKLTTVHKQGNKK